MSQLKIDLHRRVRERMRRVIADAFTLYEIAELEDKDCGEALCETLMRECAILMAASEMSAELAGTWLAVLIKRERGQLNESEVLSIMHRARVRDARGR